MFNTRLDEKIFDTPSNNMIGFISAWATIGGKEVRVGGVHWYTDKEPEISFDLKIPDFTKKRNYKQIVEEAAIVANEIKAAADVFNEMMARVTQVEDEKSEIELGSNRHLS